MREGKLPVNAEHRHTRSLAIVAQWLGAEGFNEYVARGIEYYEKSRVMNERQRTKFERIRKALSVVMRKLEEPDRLVVGKFIQMKAHMSFDAGLRIGLLKHIQEVDEGSGGRGDPKERD